MKKSVKNMLFAFILNVSFSIIELFGGILTNSISIISDALHDLGDAISIAISIIFEVRSSKEPDHKYTYGYARYSVAGALITATVLMVASAVIVYKSVLRLLNPSQVNYEGMIVLAIFGVIINGLSALKLLKGNGKGINERALTLHMFEDVLGWAAVLIGSIVIKFTGWFMIDAVMSLCISVYILIHAAFHIKEIFAILLQKSPEGIDPAKVKAELEEIEGVEDIYHIHLWTLDGIENYATLIAKITEGVSYEVNQRIKAEIREKLHKIGIYHIVIETEYYK